MLDFHRNYFELFELPQSYGLNEAQLQNAYRALQRRVHPDQFAGADAQQRRTAVQAASFVNEAFSTLRDPLARAVYLLSLHGEDVDNQSGGQLADAFLQEQMELRERLAEIEQEGLPSLRVYQAELRQRMQVLSEACAEGFAGKDLSKVKQAILAWQFYKKLFEQSATLALHMQDSDCAHNE